MKGLVKIFVLLMPISILPVSQSARAYTQCAGTISSIWAGDGGNIWLHLTDSGSAIIGPNDPNREAVLAMAMTALTASRQVIIRYAADNADCSTFGRSDFVGMYLH